MTLVHTILLPWVPWNAERSTAPFFARRLKPGSAVSVVAVSRCRFQAPSGIRRRAEESKAVATVGSVKGEVAAVRRIFVAARERVRARFDLRDKAPVAA